MRRFIYASVPTEGYKDIEEMGGKYIVRLEPTEGTDGSTSCYECMVDEEPDMDALRADLVLWKQYRTERDLLAVKKEKEAEILAYDSSPAVNSFEIRKGGVKVTDYWIDRDLRTSLEGDVIACSSVSDTYRFDIREMGITLELNCNKFLEALAVLRRYAYTAFNVTSSHIAAVKALSAEAEVNAYDYTAGYPQKLVFDIDELL